MPVMRAKVLAINALAASRLRAMLIHAMSNPTQPSPSTVTLNRDIAEAIAVRLRIDLEMHATEATDAEHRAHKAEVEARDTEAFILGGIRSAAANTALRRKLTRAVNIKCDSQQAARIHCEHLKEIEIQLRELTSALTR